MPQVISANLLSAMRTVTLVTVTLISFSVAQRLWELSKGFARRTWVDIPTAIAQSARSRAWLPSH
jgi:hypothetical protein